MKFLAAAALILPSLLLSSNVVAWTANVTAGNLSVLIFAVETNTTISDLFGGSVVNKGYFSTQSNTAINTSLQMLIGDDVPDALNCPDSYPSNEDYDTTNDGRYISCNTDPYSNDSIATSVVYLESSTDDMASYGFPYIIPVLGQIIGNISNVMYELNSVAACLRIRDGNSMDATFGEELWTAAFVNFNKEKPTFPETRVKSGALSYMTDIPMVLWEYCRFADFETEIAPGPSNSDLVEATLELIKTNETAAEIILEAIEKSILTKLL